MRKNGSPKQPTNSEAINTNVCRNLSCPFLLLEMRLYNASHSACVAVGDVVPKATSIAALRHCRSPAKLEGRVVVKITDAKVPSAFVQHARSPPPVPQKSRRTNRSTIGEAAPKSALRGYSATMKIPASSVSEQHAAGRDEAGVPSMPEEGAGEAKEGEMADSKTPEPAAGFDFEGLVLWDVDHVRAAKSHTPPFYDVVDDCGAEYVDNFNFETLPTAKILLGGDHCFYLP